MGDWNGSITGFAAGNKARAQSLQTLADLALALTGAWTTYTPAVVASAGGFTLGAGGTQTGAYRRVGKTLDWRFLIVAGTTPTWGSAGATLSVSIPGGFTSTASFLGNAFTFDTSASANNMLEYAILSGTNVARFYRPSTNVELTNGTPFTYAVGDSLFGNGTLEIA